MLRELGKQSTPLANQPQSVKFGVRKKMNVFYMMKDVEITIHKLNSI